MNIIRLLCGRTGQARMSGIRQFLGAYIQIWMLRTAINNEWENLATITEKLNNSSCVYCHFGDYFNQIPFKPIGIRFGKI